MKFFTLQLFMALVLCLNSMAQNLIINPGFENGIADWTMNVSNGASANYTFESIGSPEGNKHFKCEVKTLGTNEYNIQLRGNEFAVDETHKYRLTFKAKSETSLAVLKVYIQDKKFMAKPFTLSDSWAVYSHEFFPNEPVKQIKFNFPALANYFIDDILVEDITLPVSIFNTPPSCVITTPHVNAYYKTGSAVTINAYSTDIGGSGLAGSVLKVEFFIDDQKIGESATALNNTYTILWNPNKTGEFRIKAKAIDNLGKSFTSAGVLISIGTDNASKIGLSAGKGKYLGNVVRNTGVEPTFKDFWNGVTSGNGGKWLTVERTRDVMNWDMADEAYNLAKNNHLPYRYHTLAWGQQYPTWITTLNPSDFQEELEEFIKSAAQRYKYVDQVDVINEGLPGHQEDTKYFINGLGGAGVSGYDWAVWLFKKARQYFPNSKLVLNDFGLVNNTSNIREQQSLLKVLRDSALIDGIGAQSHTTDLTAMNPKDLKNNLDLMSISGVPIYITEMDMQGVNTDEESQLTSYQNLFPVLWEHPGVAGITLWGYIYGDMWKPDAGLIYINGTERPCMVWLKNYLGKQKDLGYPLIGDHTTSAAEIQHVKGYFEMYPNPSNGELFLQNTSANNLRITIYDVYGRLVDHFNLQSNSNVKHNLLKGVYFVNVDNHETFKLLVISTIR